MSFFENTQNVSIKGGSFSVVNGGMKVFDNSRHTTNVNSFNTRNNITSGSHNDNSQRYHGTSPHLLPPSLGRDRPRSAGDDYGGPPLYPLPPPSAHPTLMNAEYAPPGSRIHNQGSFNTTNQQADNVYNNNSQEYGSPSSSGKKRRKKKKSSYNSEDEDNDAQMAEGDESEDDPRLHPPTTPPPPAGWNGYSPQSDPSRRGDKGDPYARGAPQLRGYPPPNQPNQYQYGHSYYHPPPQPVYPYQPYGYPPTWPAYNQYPNYGGYPQPTPGVFQMGEHEKRMFTDVMNRAKQEIAKDVAEIHEENTNKNGTSAKDQEGQASDEEVESESESEPEDARRFAKAKRVPKAPRGGLASGMAKMTLDDESRPEFSRIKSDPQKPMPSGAEPAADDPWRREPQHSNSDPEIPSHLKDQAFASFGGPPMPYGPPHGVQPMWPGAGGPIHSSPFGPHALASGVSYDVHPNGYTYVDNRSHMNNFGSHNYTNNTTKDSYNDNSVKVSGQVEEMPEAPARYRREKPPRKQGPYQRS